MENLSILDQFQGFLNTPDIFSNTSNPRFRTFEFPEIPITPELIRDLEKIDHPRNSVLGKRMESFFEIGIRHSLDYELLASNIQIVHNKQTLGELDFLIYDRKNAKTLHIELVYKLYIYDPDISDSEKGWIGPNRKDSFPEKSAKLKSRQFPLLQQPETKQYLTELGIEKEEIEQCLSFKAQLFLPAEENPEIYSINKHCLRGSWFRYKDFLNKDWQENHFYCPRKRFWPCDPAAHSNWISYAELLPEIESLFEKKRSPLIWMKTSTSYDRFFIVWW